MKTFKQFMAEIADPFSQNMLANMLNRNKINRQDKKEIARLTGKEVIDNMINKYQLPTKVV